MREIDEMAVQAANDTDKLEEFVRSYELFILKCASKTSKRFISKEDDEWSIALSAFYDAIITAGFRSGKGFAGNISEACVKPHPWLYSEIANISLGIRDCKSIVGIEDSGAGVIALRLAGYQVLGMEGGNIRKSKLENACSSMNNNLCDLFEQILK